MNPFWFLGPLLLTILITVVIIYTWSDKIKCSVNEGFTDSNDFILRACPVGTKSFVTNEGNTLCCEGTVNGRNCDGKVICSMSGKVGSTPTCTDYMAAKFFEKQQKFCNSKLPNYFEENGVGGCTNGQVNGKRTAPVDGSADRCTVFNSWLDDSNPNSCKARVPKQGKCSKGMFQFGLFKGGMCCPKPPSNWRRDVNDYDSCDAPTERQCALDVMNQNGLVPCNGANLLPPNAVYRRNNFIANIYNSGNYILKFKLIYYKKASEWANIVHFTNINKDIVTVGFRMPAIWFWPNSGVFHIRLGDEKDANFGYDVDPGFSENTWMDFTLRCKDENVTVIINGKTWNFKQSGKRPIGNTNVWFSNPWFVPIQGNVTNLYFTNI